MPGRPGRSLPTLGCGKAGAKSALPRGEERKELVPSAKGDCWFLLTSEAGPDTHVREEKPCGEQAQPQKLWGAQAGLLLSPHGNPLGEEGRANPQGTERPQQDAQSWEALRS